MLEQPWSAPRGTENHTKQMHRAHLDPSYPEDLARDSTPETGSLGDSTMPIENRTPPFKLRGGR